jgi:hypothetical protein
VVHACRGEQLLEMMALKPGFVCRLWVLKVVR